MSKEQIKNEILQRMSIKDFELYNECLLIDKEKVEAALDEIAAKVDSYVWSHMSRTEAFYTFARVCARIYADEMLRRAGTINDLANALQPLERDSMAGKRAIVIVQVYRHDVPYNSAALRRIATFEKEKQS